MLTLRAVACAVVLATTACTRVVGGTAAPGSDSAPPHGFDVGGVLLDQPRMQAITGGNEYLTVIPSMDSSSPVDIDTLAQTAPPQCRFVFADTATFGPDVENFHKTTFQDPPHGGLISEGAAAYPDGDTARHAFGALVSTVRNCADSSSGYGLVGAWNADDRSLRTRPGDCGRDYLLKSVVLVEVTYCGYPDSVSTIVMSNIAANVPG